MTTHHYDYDILTIGGGVIGQAVAIALSDQGYQIGIIEKADPIQQLSEGFDIRTIALSYGSYLILNKLKVWEGLQETVYPIHQIHISEQGKYGKSQIDAKEYDVPALGYNVSLLSLLKSMREKVNRCQDIKDYFCAELINITRIEHGYQVTLKQNGNELVLKTRFLVAADGGSSNVRTLLGMNKTERDYKQHAVTTNVCVDLKGQHVAYERFTTLGPLAMLPIDSDRYALVWCVTPEKANELLALSEDEFLQQLQKIFGYRLGRLKQIGKRQAFPLRLITSNEIARPHVCLLGNALCSLHPVAGQGFNLGLRGVIDFATFMEKYFNKDCYLSEESMQSFIHSREQDRNKMIRLTDSLVRIFSNNIPGLRSVRHFGLLGIDFLTNLKQPLVQLNMGLLGQ